MNEPLGGGTLTELCTSERLFDSSSMNAPAFIPLEIGRGNMSLPAAYFIMTDNVDLHKMLLNSSFAISNGIHDVSSGAGSACHEGRGGGSPKNVQAFSRPPRSRPGQADAPKRSRKSLHIFWG